MWCTKCGCKGEVEAGLCLKGRGMPPPPQRPSYNSTRRHVRNPNTTPTRVSNRQLLPPNRFYSAPQPLCYRSEFAPRAPSPSSKPLGGGGPTRPVTHVGQNRIVLQQLELDRQAARLQGVRHLLLLLAHELLDVPVLLRVRVPEPELLQLGFELPDAQAVGQGRDDLQGLSRVGQLILAGPQLQMPQDIQPEVKM